MNTISLVTSKAAPTFAPGESRADTATQAPHTPAPSSSLSPAAAALVTLARTHGWRSLREMPRAWHVTPGQPPATLRGLDQVTALDQDRARLQAENEALNTRLHELGNAGMRDIALAVLPLTEEIERLKADLTAARKIAPLPVESLEIKQQVAELRAGLEAVRQAITEAYPGSEVLTLDKRIIGLGKERDMWRRRAEAAEAANRAATQEAIQAAQRATAAKSS
jgi:hypothetical protein